MINPWSLLKNRGARLIWQEPDPEPGTETNLGSGGYNGSQSRGFWTGALACDRMLQLGYLARAKTNSVPALRSEPEPLHALGNVNEIIQLVVNTERILNFWFDFIWHDGSSPY